MLANGEKKSCDVQGSLKSCLKYTKIKNIIISISVGYG
jgi:hypothetical protein